MITWRVKRAMKKGIPVMITIIVLLAILLIVKTYTGKAATPPQTQAKYELTETDIFSLPNINAKEISVKGVVLSDTQEQVIDKIGDPDNQFSPRSGIINMEYGKQLGLFDTGLIIQLRDGKVRKITVKQPFNPFLQGETKITHTKEEIYHLLGKPDETLFVPITPTSVLIYRLLQYKDKGIEVIIRKQEQNGFTITDVFDSKD